MCLWLFRKRCLVSLERNNTLLRLQAYISDEFSVEEFHKRLVVKRLAVIYISRCDHEVEQFPLLVTDQVQLEPEEPAHGALPPLGNALERLVDVDSLISAYPERSAVYETDARTLSQQYLLDEQSKGNGDILLLFNKPVVGYQLGEQMPQMLRHMLQIEMLQTAIPGTMKQYHDQHDFCLGKSSVTVVRTLIRGFYGIFCHHCIIKICKNHL